ncbi:SDR family NAD(P)-dependent oxidoreductase [Streptomyces sp. NPDC048248]|uniref:SDR family NAD(P)-dependent oxidoreductase n=1 Tax=Streptomyces sp. NPDC048248 TaxID=3365523 RepID=UPI003724AA6D
MSRWRKFSTSRSISSSRAAVHPVDSSRRPSDYYSAAKAALESVTASLRGEVTPLGITAVVVEPGAFRTDFAGRRLRRHRRRSPIRGNRRQAPQGERHH